MNAFHRFWQSRFNIFNHVGERRELVILVQTRRMKPFSMGKANGGRGKGAGEAAVPTLVGVGMVSDLPVKGVSDSS